MNALLTNASRFLKKNSPTILTCVGAIGTIATAVLAVKATPKAMLIIEQAEQEKGKELTKIEVVKAAAPVYIPAIVTCASTIACIFGANVLNQRSQASLASAYALIDRSFKEYKAKVEELYGKETTDTVREEIAKDRYEGYTYEFSEEKRLFFDDFSLRFFESTMEEVLAAERRFNENFAMSGSACVNELYDCFGADRLNSGYQLGWSAYSGNEDVGIRKVNFEHQKMVVGDDMECYAIIMDPQPNEGYIY